MPALSPLHCIDGRGSGGCDAPDVMGVGRNVIGQIGAARESAYFKVEQVGAPDKEPCGPAAK